MIHLVFAIDVKSCHIIEVEFFLIQNFSIYLSLLAILANDFEKYGAVAVEDLICFPDRLSGCTTQFNMVFILTLNRAEYLICPSGKGRFTHTAKTTRRGHD